MLDSLGYFSTAFWCLLFGVFVAACAAYSAVGISRVRIPLKNDCPKKRDLAQMKKEPSTSVVESIFGERAAKVSGFGLFSRQAIVFYAAGSVFLDYKICQWRCNRMRDDDKKEEKENELWDRAHERNSKYLCKKFISLEGLWVKLGQYLSSRADVMPASYLKDLAKCQVQPAFCWRALNFLYIFFGLDLIYFSTNSF